MGALLLAVTAALLAGHAIWTYANRLTELEAEIAWQQRALVAAYERENGLEAKFDGFDTTLIELNDEFVSMVETDDVQRRTELAAEIRSLLETKVGPFRRLAEIDRLLTDLTVTGSRVERAELRADVLGSGDLVFEAPATPIIIAEPEPLDDWLEIVLPVSASVTASAVAWFASVGLFLWGYVSVH